MAERTAELIQIEALGRLCVKHEWFCVSMTGRPLDRACGGASKARPDAANAAEFVPWLQGAALCNGCGHQWQAVTPSGARVDALECPACHAFKGVLLHHVQYDKPGVAYWRCGHCSGVLFSALRVEDDAPMISCANCGSTAWAADLFPAP